MDVGGRTHEIINLVRDSGYLGVTLALTDDHHLDGRLFDFA